MATVAIALIAFGAGYFVRSPQSSILEAADKEVPVYASAEMRVVDEGLVTQALIIDGENLDVLGTSVTDSIRPVVTDQVLENGSELSTPAYLGAVSGRPLFALSLLIPLYRDLHYLDSGPDVESLQSALGVEATGVFDSDTREVLFDLYDNLDLDPPGDTYWQSFVRMSEIVAIPSNGKAPVVTSTSPLGTVLSDTVPIVQLQMGPDQITFRADVQEVSQIEQGETVKVNGSNGAEASATVVSIGEFKPAKDTEIGSLVTTAGYEILLDFAGDHSSEAFGVGQSVTVSSTATAQEPSLSIPLLAVRQDGPETFVVRHKADGRDESVRVEVAAQGGGWASIHPGNLNEGDKVKVAP